LDALAELFELDEQLAEANSGRRLAGNWNIRRAEGFVVVLS
jgi:hypothetical protein